MVDFDCVAVLFFLAGGRVSESTRVLAGQWLGCWLVGGDERTREERRRWVGPGDVG
jgi:hypothetical protein